MMVGAEHGLDLGIEATRRAGLPAVNLAREVRQRRVVDDGGMRSGDSVQAAAANTTIPAAVISVRGGRTRRSRSSSGQTA
jgi:hypothetical protein